MSGHSKWNNIKRTKGVRDSKKSSLFTKISKDIITAVQLGGSGDISNNPMLRVPVEKAKAANMSNDKIEKAISKGLGHHGSDDLITFNKIYEAYGPESVAMLIESETDNPTRTIAEIKNVLNKRGFKILNEGSVSWKFKEVGRILLEIPQSIDAESEIIMSLLEEVDLQDYTIYQNENMLIVELIVPKELFNKIYKLLSSDQYSKYKIMESGLVRLSSENKEIQDQDTMQELIDALEDLPDVTLIWSEDKRFINS